MMGTPNVTNDEVISIVRKYTCACVVLYFPDVLNAEQAAKEMLKEEIPCAAESLSDGRGIVIVFGGTVDGTVNRALS